MKRMKRDPHLPSPEVCDWLLSQEWSTPETLRFEGKHSKGYINDCCEASAAIGRNEIINLYLPAFGLRVLRDDAAARKAGEYEIGANFAERADLEGKKKPKAGKVDEDQQLVIDINGVIESANVSATAAVGACTMVAIALTSQIYDLAMQESKAQVP
jgi:hypothetical protein